MTTSTIVECHKGADLVRRMTAVFARWGAATIIGPQRENLCRRLRENEGVSGLAGDLDPPRWVVEAQGLPNLVHEFIHAVFLGRLDDDHGFDYGEIPLDLEHPDHRAHLWEELACCGLSATTCAPLVDEPGFALAWFVEQFEIQGVFHGLEHDLHGFRAHVDTQLQQPARVAELEATVARAHAEASRLLYPDRGPGADGRLPDCQVTELWQDYRVYAGLAHTQP